MTSILHKLHGFKLPILALCGIVFALYTLISQPKQLPREPLSQPVTNPFEGTISGIGVIEPNSELISIGTELPGIVRSIYVENGQKVKKGDLLFSLDQELIDTEISTLEASITSAKIEADNFADQFAIVENIKDTRALSKDLYNQRKYAKLLAESKVNELQQQLAAASTQKRLLNVYSPIDGTILDVNIHPGEYVVAAPQNTPYILMGNIEPFYVRVEIDELYANKVSGNEMATGYLRCNTTQGIPLSFVRIEPHVQQKQNLAVVNARVDTRVLQILYALPKNASNVYAGQQMDVFIQTH